MLIFLILMGGVALGATAKTAYDGFFAQTLAELDKHVTDDSDLDTNLIIKEFGIAEKTPSTDPMNSRGGDHGYNASDFMDSMTLFHTALDQEPDGYQLFRFVYNVPTKNWYAEYRPM